MRVFVSSQVVDGWPARELIAGLRAAGIDVDHSPSNPDDREDPRWPRWYAEGLGAAIDRCDVFVAVIEPGWDSSTWMAIEAEAGSEKGRRPAARAYFWNPDDVRVHAAGMRGYLRAELPRELDAAVACVCQALRRGAATSE